MKTIVFLTLWWLLANQSWCLVIGYNSAHDLTLNLGKGSFKALFASTPLSDVSMPLVGELLTNPHSNLRPYYFSSCARRTDLHLVLHNAANLTETTRDALLDWQCLEKAPMIRAWALSMQLPTAVPLDYAVWTREEWIVAFQTAQYPHHWCVSVPTSFLDDNFLDEIDLVSHLKKRCLEENYPSRTLIVNALHRRLLSASEESLTRFLLEFRKLWLGPDTESILKYVICMSLSGTETAALNAALYRCPNLSTTAPNVEDKVRALLQGDSSTSYKLCLLKILMLETGIPSVLSTVNPQRPPIEGVSCHQVLQFVTEHLDNVNAEDKQDLLALLGIQYQATLSHLSTPVHLLLEQSFEMRLALYRQAAMMPVSNYVRPRHYLCITNDTLNRALERYISSNDYLRNGNMFRPRVLSNLQKLETVLNLLIYSLVVFGNLPVRLNPAFCSDFGREYHWIDFAHYLSDPSNRPLSMEQLELRSVRIERQFRRLWKSWGFDIYFSSDLCSMLTAQY
ncbi:hypothetical protein PSACC_01071 [Paramicrosporidium saccamoebae]|uniref:Uncharacterized protein n=1 Tax=Paramicrosporidium saccamoebae TaxID=1246581 RepID=A0A2H9TN13_9FUNG|nr:hypothetical protein PSACC_01071 [Paramicrosporidium saccamoebae]